MSWNFVPNSRNDKLLSFICYKCGDSITFKNFHSSRQCKPCSKKSIQESNRTGQRIWYNKNKKQAKENEYDRRDRHLEYLELKFIENFKHYNPVKELRKRYAD